MKVGMQNVAPECSIPQHRRLAVACIGLFALQIVSGCVVLKARFTPRHLDQYQGDGHIFKVKHVINPGVKVEFERFQLSGHYEATYHLDGLPKRPDLYRVMLVVPLGPDYVPTLPIKIGVEGDLTFELLDSTGQAIFSCRGSPDQLGWVLLGVGDGEAGIEATGMPCPVPYEREHVSTIEPHDLDSGPSRASLLKVSWQPRGAVTEMSGFVRVITGGPL